MTTSEVIQQSALLIIKDFDLEPFKDNSLSKEGLLKTLTEVVQHFLDKDLNRLLNILYRIDISEIEVKCILSTAAPDEMSRLLATKILQRELKKAETRIRYSSPESL